MCPTKRPTQLIGPLDRDPETTEGGKVPRTEEEFQRLVSAAYDQLRAIAHRQLQRKRPGTVTTTGLVHEAFAKLAPHSHAGWNDRTHFLAVASRAMRQILVDYARGQCAQKRGRGWVRVSLDEALVRCEADDAALLLALDKALEKLGALEPRLIRVVECRYFAGLTEAETAEVLSVSSRTVQRDWRRARAWLMRELERSE
jgi:RNA polymerase sigma factor (TIGR02999 family)